MTPEFARPQVEKRGSWLAPIPLVCYSVQVRSESVRETRIIVNEIANYFTGIDTIKNSKQQ